MSQHHRCGTCGALHVLSARTLVHDAVYGARRRSLERRRCVHTAIGTRVRDSDGDAETACIQRVDRAPTTRRGTQRIPQAVTGAPMSRCARLTGKLSAAESESSSVHVRLAAVRTNDANARRNERLLACCTRLRRRSARAECVQRGVQRRRRRVIRIRRR